MICLKCGKEYEGNSSITGNGLCPVCDAVMVHMDGPMREAKKRHTPSAISVIRELEATIERQRKVIKKLADRIYEFARIVVGHPCKICGVGSKCNLYDPECTSGIIAYAEKQVEDGR